MFSSEKYACENPSSAAEKKHHVVYDTIYGAILKKQQKKKTRLTEEGYPEGDQKLFTTFLKDNDKVL